MTARSSRRNARQVAEDNVTAFVNAFVDPASPAPIDDARADVCTVAEAARWLKVNRKTVYDAVNRRELPSARLGRRVLLSRAAITAWLAGRLR
jgi:excisionase family DNA binding protein